MVQVNVIMIDFLQQNIYDIVMTNVTYAARYNKNEPVV